MTKLLAPEGSQRWGGLEQVRTERVLLHNLIVGGGTLAAGLLGVGFQSIVSHQLKPADYGSVFAVVTLITFIGLPGSAFTLLSARETSKGRASGHHALSANLLRRGNKALMLFGTGLGGLMAAGSVLISRFLAVPAELVVVAAVGVPFSLALPLLMGAFQGDERFVAYSTLMTGQAGAKLVAAIGLGALFGPVGIVAGISLATITIYIVAMRILRTRLAIRAKLPWWQPAARYLVVVLPSTVSLAILLSADVLIVKHFFPTRAAGEYAAVAAIGRAIFWGATGVAAVLFPKVVFRATHGNSGFQLVGTSLALVVVGGLAGFAVLAVGGRWLLTLFAGGAYANAAIYLPWYAVSMTLLGGVAVLMAAHQSHARASFLILLVPLTAVEPVLLIGFHSTLLQLVQVLSISIGIILAGLAILYLVHERARGMAPVDVVGNTTASRAVSSW